MALIGRPDAGGVRPITLDRCVRSTRSEVSVEPDDSISWGLLFKFHGRLLLTLLVIFIDITT
jgi:hypothetical protein